ncbi:MAG: FecR family protein [Flavobacteriales bacterium]
MSKNQDIFKGWKVPNGKSTEQAWLEVEAKMKQRQSQSKVVTFSWRPMISVAAAAVVIVGLILFWPNHELKTYSSTTGHVEVVNLPDASVATLNAGSSITFSEDWSEERVLDLKGQAFFEVKKGSKFSVVTPTGVVEVLGTSFDVYSRENDLRVACYTGRVMVRVGTQELEITPGYTAMLHNGNLQVGEFNNTDADWRTGEFTFDAAPLSDVFHELERQFGVRIQTPSLEGRLYTGRFNNKNLDEALQLICLPMGLKFMIQQDGEVIVDDVQNVK